MKKLAFFILCASLSACVNQSYTNDSPSDSILKDSVLKDSAKIEKIILNKYYENDDYKFCIEVNRDSVAVGRLTTKSNDSSALVIGTMTSATSLKVSSLDGSSINYDLTINDGAVLKVVDFDENPTSNIVFEKETKTDNPEKMFEAADDLSGSYSWVALSETHTYGGQIEIKKDVAGLYNLEINDDWQETLVDHKQFDLKAEGNVLKVKNATVKVYKKFAFLSSCNNSYYARFYLKNNVAVTK